MYELCGATLLSEGDSLGDLGDHRNLLGEGDRSLAGLRSGA